MAVIYTGKGPTRFVEAQGSKILCHGFVSYNWQHVQRVFDGDFNLEMYGGLILSRKYRKTRETETVLPSNVSEVRATTEFNGKKVRISWIPGLEKFTVEET